MGLPTCTRVRADAHRPRQTPIYGPFPHPCCPSSHPPPCMWLHPTGHGPRMVRWDARHRRMSRGGVLHGPTPHPPMQALHRVAWSPSLCQGLCALPRRDQSRRSQPRPLWVTKPQPDPSSRRMVLGTMFRGPPPPPPPLQSPLWPPDPPRSPGPSSSSSSLETPVQDARVPAFPNPGPPSPRRQPVPGVLPSQPQHPVPQHTPGPPHPPV